jgi:hypothetical protein
MHKGRIGKRQDNLGLIDRLDRLDVLAVYRGIAAYQTGGLEVVEIAPQGDQTYATYAKPSRDAFDQVILQSERDWIIEGVSDYRIANRITIMKLFYDQWQLPAIYAHIAKNDYSAPEYKPLNDTEMAVVIDSIRKYRKKGSTYQEIINRSMADWQASFKASREAANGLSEKQLSDLVVELYDTVFERAPEDFERDDNLTLMRGYLANLQMQQAIAKLIESMVLSTEFAYRNEFGVGEADAHGRRMMSPRDASYALAYALTDSSPDDELTNAAESGRLKSRDDYGREVRRMLARRDQWTIIDEAVQAANINASVTNQPIRKLRFFRDFFGYPKALKVFKDDHRFGAGRHEPAVSRLIDEADLLVEHILEKDKRVFEELLTTETFYVYHSGDNKVMQQASDRLKAYYDHFKGYDWEDWGPAELSPHKAFIVQSNVLGGEKIKSAEASRENDAAVKSFKRQMENLTQRFGNGQKNAAPYHTFNRGFWKEANVRGRTDQHMRGEQVATYWNIDWRTWDYPAQQPAKMPNRKGILTHPAWLIAHSQNLETDPIHRGKWVQEKLLAGTIPDVPITVDAVIHPDKNKTLRQRMETRTGEAYCWRCHQKMDPLGFPFEQYDDFGRFRLLENLEHPDNLTKSAKEAELSFGAKLARYKTQPVDPRGTLKGTGDDALDGNVKDAFDLIDRLAASDKVRQSIIRHAFRYFLGRNETLSDSKTLMNADKAYLESNGSFDALIISLLTSDSFIYRKPVSAEPTQASVNREQ